MNRLNIKSIFAAVAIASVTFTSCDGYLETFPSDSLVSTDAITTLQDVETALNGTYYSLKSANYYGCDFVSRAEVGVKMYRQSLPGVKNRYLLSFHTPSE